MNSRLYYTALFLVVCPLGARADAATLPEQASGTTTSANACSAAKLQTIVDRGRSNTNPCIVGKHHVVLETGYYQNASAVGGTALAAYPLAVLRYGINARTEISVSPATAIAKSGANGAGIYTWSRSGGGLRYVVSDTGMNALSASVQYTPQSDETASLSTRERYDFGVADRVAINAGFSVSGSVGNEIFTQQTVSGNQQSSLYARLDLSQALNDRLTVNVLGGRDAHVVMNSMPQTQLGVSLQDALSKNALADVEVGSALNAAGDTKAHYLGFGISLKH